MKSWQKWIVPLIMICTVQVGMVGAAEKALTKTEKLAEELTQVLAELDGGLLAENARVQRIALLVARVTEYSPSLLADFSRQVSANDLRLVTAAAVISAGSRSPAVLETIQEAQDTDASRSLAIRAGATRPVQYLGTETAALVQSVQVQPIASAPIRTEASINSSSSVDDFPPPQPPGLPPRPPALPYRGQ